MPKTRYCRYFVLIFEFVSPLCWVMTKKNSKTIILHIFLDTKLGEFEFKLKDAIDRCNRK